MTSIFLHPFVLIWICKFEMNSNVNRCFVAAPFDFHFEIYIFNLPFDAFSAHNPYCLSSKYNNRCVKNIYNIFGSKFVFTIRLKMRRILWLIIIIIQIEVKTFSSFIERIESMQNIQHCAAFANFIYFFVAVAFFLNRFQTRNTNDSLSLSECVINFMVHT